MNSHSSPMRTHVCLLLIVLVALPCISSAEASYRFRSLNSDSEGYAGLTVTAADASDPEIQLTAFRAQAAEIQVSLRLAPQLSFLDTVTVESTKTQAFYVDSLAGRSPPRI